MWRADSVERRARTHFGKGVALDLRRLLAGSGGLAVLGRAIPSHALRGGLCRGPKGTAEAVSNRECERNPSRGEGRRTDEHCSTKAASGLSSASLEKDPEKELRARTYSVC